MLRAGACATVFSGTRRWQSARRYPVRPIPAVLSGLPNVLHLTTRRSRAVAAAALALIVAAVGAVAGVRERATAATIPVLDHVVVAVFENHSFGQIIGSSS